MYGAGEYGQNYYGNTHVPTVTPLSTTETSTLTETFSFLHGVITLETITLTEKTVRKFFAQVLETITTVERIITTNRIVNWIRGSRPTASYTPTGRPTTSYSPTGRPTPTWRAK